MNTQFPAGFGRYRLLGKLGAGGMAEVFRAETQPIAGITRTIAIKRILGSPKDGELRTMLLDEARIWVQLHHPNIVSVIDFGEEKGDWFLALELVEGCTASQLISRTGPISAKEALCICERVLRALDHAHTLVGSDGKPLRVVHRDVKPANVLLSTRGEIKLTDFGIASATNRGTRTVTGVIKGSVPFLSPEQVRGDDLDGRSDLFAMGSMLHELLTGDVLFQGTREATLLALSRGEIPAPDASLPPSVRSLIASLTAPDRRDRPSTAADAGKQLRAMLLPESPEDLEPSIGARVRGAQSERPAPRPAPMEIADTAPSPVSVSVITDLRPSGEAPSAIETAPAARPPVPSRSASWKLRRFETPGLILGSSIVAALFVTFATLAWLCRDAQEKIEAARDGSSYENVAGADRAACRWCGSTPALEAGAILALARAGKAEGGPARDGASAAEQRASTMARIAAHSWAASTVELEAAVLARGDRDDRCLAHAIRWDRRLEEAIDAAVGAGTDCEAALSIGKLLASGRALTSSDLPHDRFSARIAILDAEVAALHPDDAFELEGALTRARRLALDSDAITGVWIAPSWAPLPGERGHLATPLDDPEDVIAMIRGDAAARAGDFARAIPAYRRLVDRHGSSEDAAVRLADAMLAAHQPDAAAAALAAILPATSLGEASVNRLVLVSIERGQAAEGITRLKQVRDASVRSVLMLRAIEEQIASAAAADADLPDAVLITPPAGRADAITHARALAHHRKYPLALHQLAAIPGLVAHDEEAAFLAWCCLALERQPDADRAAHEYQHHFANAEHRAVIEGWLATR